MCDWHGWRCCNSISETQKHEKWREKGERRGEGRGREHTFSETPGDLSLRQAAWRVAMICSSVFPSWRSVSIRLAMARHSWHVWGVCSGDGSATARVGGGESITVTVVGWLMEKTKPEKDRGKGEESGGCIGKGNIVNVHNKYLILILIPNALQRPCESCESCESPFLGTWSGVRANAMDPEDLMFAGQILESTQSVSMLRSAWRVTNICGTYSSTASRHCHPYRDREHTQSTIPAASSTRSTSDLRMLLMGDIFVEQE